MSTLQKISSKKVNVNTDNGLIPHVIEKILECNHHFGLKQDICYAFNIENSNEEELKNILENVKYSPFDGGIFIYTKTQENFSSEQFFKIRSKFLAIGKLEGKEKLVKILNKNIGDTFNDDPTIYLDWKPEDVLSDLKFYPGDFGTLEKEKNAHYFYGVGYEYPDLVKYLQFGDDYNLYTMVMYGAIDVSNKTTITTLAMMFPNLNFDIPDASGIVNTLICKGFDDEFVNSIKGYLQND